MLHAWLQSEGLKPQEATVPKLHEFKAWVQNKRNVILISRTRRLTPATQAQVIVQQEQLTIERVDAQLQPASEDVIRRGVRVAGEAPAADLIDRPAGGR